LRPTNPPDSNPALPEASLSYTTAIEISGSLILALVGLAIWLAQRRHKQSADDDAGAPPSISASIPAILTRRTIDQDDAYMSLISSLESADNGSSSSDSEFLRKKKIAILRKASHWSPTSSADNTLGSST
jgi:hypothetical protein